MSPQREGVRGAAKDHHGPTSVTMQIWYELQQAGEAGLTLDELVDKVSPRVPVGYAWRRYLRQRAAEQRLQAPRAKSALGDTPAHRASAVRYVIRSSASKLVSDRSAIRRPDGRYAMGARKPKSVFTDDQHDFDGSLSRKQVAIMELLRQCRVLRAKVEADRARNPPSKHLPAVSTVLYAAIERFLDAHAPTI